MKHVLENVSHALFWILLGYFTDPGWAALALALLIFFTVREILQKDSRSQGSDED